MYLPIHAGIKDNPRYWKWPQLAVETVTVSFPNDNVGHHSAGFFWQKAFGEKISEALTVACTLRENCVWSTLIAVH